MAIVITFNGLYILGARNFLVYSVLRGFKNLVDRSKVPTLVDTDVEEQFIRGSGPGGSNVNKNSNCVLLKHLPTGTVVKCHQHRLLEHNRKLARDMMVTKLDNLFNGEMSVENQLKKMQEQKSIKTEYKRKKIRLVKEKWKQNNLLEYK